MNAHRVAASCLSALLLLFAPCVLPAPQFPALTGRVMDQANLLDTETQRRLDSALQNFEQASAIQLVVVTVPDLQGAPIEEFGYQLGRFWGIGQKDKNTGVLLIVAQAERKIRIEVGYGLESKLTDALSENIIQTVILPPFKQGQPAVGIEQGAAAIIAALDGSYQSRATRRSSREQSAPSWLYLVMVIIVFLLRGFGGFGHRRGGYFPGGFGGGGGGGFRGGGGGFGGGGASGGW